MSPINCARPQPGIKAHRREQKAEDLNALPEIQVQIAEAMRAHYRDWPSQKLPALKGKTPLQAIRTRDGKEMVAALLMDFERRGKHTSPPLDPAIIAEYGITSDLAAVFGRLSRMAITSHLPPLFGGLVDWLVVSSVVLSKAGGVIKI